MEYTINFHISIYIMPGLPDFSSSSYTRRRREREYNKHCCCPKKPGGGAQGPQGTTGPQGATGVPGSNIIDGNCYSDYLYWDKTPPGQWKNGNSDVVVGTTTVPSENIHIGCGAQEGNATEWLGPTGPVAPYASARPNPKSGSIAIGSAAGQYLQGNGINGPQECSIAIGSSSGQSNQGGGAIAIGGNAKFTDAPYSAAKSAGRNNQGDYAIAIGSGASPGWNYINSGGQVVSDQTHGQGKYSIAIGYRAGNSIGNTSGSGTKIVTGTTAPTGPFPESLLIQPDNNIIINATESQNAGKYNAGTGAWDISHNACYILPIREHSTPTPLYYDPKTHEVTYSSSVPISSPTVVAMQEKITTLECNIDSLSTTVNALKSQIESLL